MKQKPKTRCAFRLLTLILAQNRSAVVLIEARELPMFDMINVLQGLHVAQKESGFRLHTANGKLTVADVAKASQGREDQGKTQTSLNVDASQNFSSRDSFRDIMILS